MGVKFKILAKCSDSCGIHINGEEIHYGYVPEFLGQASTDIIELDIDAETGQILNWKSISEETIREQCEAAGP